jgi:uncharacterized protein YcfJ
MKRSIETLVAAAGLVLASGAAFANRPNAGPPGAHEDTDFADVVRVEPLHRQVRVSEPVRERWPETSYASEGPFSYNHIGGTLLGSTLGVVVGARGQTYERCDTHYRDRYVERIDGYQVTYAYAAREYVTRMPYDPGERIRVRVDVSPAEG